MQLDFGALPPEVNSLRMYTGPGSAPLLAAMTAWDELAAEMSLAATAYESILSSLISDGWLGPASEAMAAAVSPYVLWMSATSALAEQTAGQAAAAAAAFEAAFAMTVPPAAVAANRARLLALVATNFFGVNTPAIAAAEAEYAEMWAQDATAMYAYAASAAEASALDSFNDPAPIANPFAQAGQAVSQATGTATGGVTQSASTQLLSAVPAGLQQLASPAAASPFDAFPQTGSLADLLNFLDGADGNPFGIFLDSSLFNGLVSSAQYVLPGMLVPAVTDAIADVNSVAEDADTIADAGAVGAANAAESAVAITPTGAGINQANFVGRLSVPPSWTVAVEVAEHGAVALPGTPGLAAIEAAPSAPGVPGMPALNSYARSWGNGPRYGFKLTVMPRPVAAG